jgi:hypothetical protein
MLDREQVYKLLHERHSVQRRIARATFPLWQRLGFHVVGDHFYDPIPNTDAIRAGYVPGPRELPGLEVDWPSCAAAASLLMQAYLDDYLRHRSAFGYTENNYYFYGIDALYYYALIRARRPRRIVEIGQGCSTRVALAALAHDAGRGALTELVSIDPYARLRLPSPAPVRLAILKSPLQSVAHEIPEMLAGTDLLFVDSSHVFKFGSDVQLLFERIYPRLRPGVMIHIHDVFTPYDYPAEWMLSRRQFWNEQYFVESFLAYNRNFHVETPIHFLVRSGAIDAVLSARACPPETVRREGQSLYLTREG